MARVPNIDRRRIRTHTIPPGQVVRRRGSALEITSKNDGSIRDIPAIAQHLPGTTPGSGWITWAEWTNATGSPISTFRTQWTVPPLPTANDSQLLYLFNGLMPATRDEILQPVLQWGVSPSGGGPTWQVANWFISKTGEGVNSAFFDVNPGQTLTGTMKLEWIDNSQAGSPTFAYTSVFEEYPDSQINVTYTTELTVASLTLEAYFQKQATISDYPAGQTTFSAIEIDSAAGAMPFAWAFTNEVTDCNQSTPPSGPNVVISY